MELVEGQSGSKEKGSIHSVDGTIDGEGWTQSYLTNCEDDLFFCIMKNSRKVLMNEKIEQ